MELKYLKTFKTILETGSFRQTAKQLNYAQSTITMQMQLLEQELSVKLFEKIGRKMVLTQAGKDLIPYIDNILNTFYQIENYGKSNKNLTGTLRISMPETLLSYKMIQPLKQFRNIAPNVKLSLQSSNCYEIRNQVINGSVDLGIHYDIGKCSDSLITEQLQQYEFILVGSPKLDDNEADFITPNQQKSLCLLSDRSSYYYKKFKKYLEQYNIIIDSEIDLISTEAIKQLVKANLGIAYLPRFVIEEELNDGIIQELTTAITNNDIGTVCNYHKNKWITPAMELFLQLLRTNDNSYNTEKIQSQDNI